MYLELSRPQGDAGRWEKVLKRLTLLNKTYPLRGKDCDFMEIQRMFDPEKKLPEGLEKKVFYIEYYHRYFQLIFLVPVRKIL